MCAGCEYVNISNIYVGKPSKNGQLFAENVLGTDAHGLVIYRYTSIQSRILKHVPFGNNVIM